MEFKIHVHTAKKALTLWLTNKKRHQITCGQCSRQQIAILADIWFSRRRHDREEPKSWLKWKSQNSVIHEFWSTQNEMHGCCNCLPLDFIVDPQQKYTTNGRIRAFFFVHCFESFQIVPGVLSGSIIMTLMVLRVRRNRPRSTITRHSFLKNGSSTCKL